MLLDGREPQAEYERVRDDVLAAFFASKRKADLLEAAVARRLLIAPVTDAADVAASPQLAARCYWDAVDMGENGTVTFPGAIAKPSATPLPPLPRPPLVGEHTEEVLGADARAAAPKRGAARPGGGSSKAALEGVKVLDLMWVMAGPAASRVLADYGAEVVKVESTHRIDTCRTLSPFVNNEGHPELSGLFNNLNANKRALALNLADPRSHEVMVDLVRWADVVVD